MKRIINGKRYNTETATLIAHVGSATEDVRDFRYHDTNLYRTVRGNWFVAGKGGPMSQWARSTGQNSWSGGSGLRPIDPDEARDLLEDHRYTAELEQYFSSDIEDA